MRKIVVGAFVSLDGVMQAPGGPEEDALGGFAHGGWTVPYWDDALGEAMGELFAAPFDLLLGRRTYDIFAGHWPRVTEGPDKDIADLFNAVAKHVATHRPGTLTWQNSQAIGPDIAAGVRRLKEGEGPTLLVQGSSELIQILLAEDLVDEFRLLVFPLVLGRGKRLFGNGTLPGAFRLTGSSSSPGGVIVANYRRAGAVTTGSFALDPPRDSEPDPQEGQAHA
ncbi:dihydrofolate reductase [Allostella sp. ATCC 35155]|nr:dihydrofolate reductase [Stella sp. ATCC 35155]